MPSTSYPSNITSTHAVRSKYGKTKKTAVVNHSAYKKLHKLIQDKKAQVGVIGMGYVGLPLSMVFTTAGYKVTGFDKDKRKVKSINDGKSYIQDVETKEIAKFRKSKKINASADFAGLSQCDVIVVCVPTPLSKTKDPDMSYIMSAVKQIRENLRPGQLIVLESTTYPGTTREIVLPELTKSSGKKSAKTLECGKDFFITFSPERVDPGNSKFNTYNTPKVVGGMTPACTDLGCLFYSKALKQVIRVSSPESAEMVKLLENTFRSINIGLVNEVTIMCNKLGLDCWEVIEAASTKPFGFMPFYPGPGLGGHCIPIDPSYLSWKLRSLNYTARFIELANTINTSMPSFCVGKISEALNEHSKAVKNSKILIVGVAYKKDIEDMRESPALDIIHLLQDKGAKIDYYDPYVPEINWEGTKLSSVKWKKNLAKDYDLVVITTDHSNVDYKALLDHSKQIFDTRNALKKFHDPKITKL
jgi:UDP-N-acetyl-D-glucosamine dehydrogenase